jgi:hypothetical protein
LLEIAASIDNWCQSSSISGAMVILREICRRPANSYVGEMEMASTHCGSASNRIAISCEVSTCLRKCLCRPVRFLLGTTRLNVDSGLEHFL